MTPAAPAGKAGLMGTFHDDTDPLHGITVVADCGPTVYVGRCHERDSERLVLLDADTHTEGQDGKSNVQYLERAARFGVWKQHERLVLPVAQVRTLAPLSEHYRRAGRPTGPVVTVPGPAAADENDRHDEPRSAPQADADLAQTSADAAVTLTDSARREVRRLLVEESNPTTAKPDQGLRLAVAGGGCSGLVYKVAFGERKDGDMVIAEDGFEVYLDRKSTIYLRGIVLDFRAGLMGRGFQFHNPNASNTCGCGESFSV